MSIAPQITVNKKVFLGEVVERLLHNWYGGDDNKGDDDDKDDKERMNSFRLFIIRSGRDNIDSLIDKFHIAGYM